MNLEMFECIGDNQATRSIYDNYVQLWRTALEENKQLGNELIRYWLLDIDTPIRMRIKFQLFYLEIGEDHAYRCHFGCDRPLSDVIGGSLKRVRHAVRTN